MQGIHMRSFNSPGEFLRTVAGLYQGPTFVKTFLALEGQFREKVILTESFTNNCGM